MYHMGGHKSSSVKETPLGGPLSLQAPPGTFVDFGFKRIDDSTGYYYYEFKGRPHRLAINGLEAATGGKRWPVFIWHRVEVEISCDSFGVGRHKLRKHEGSGFPSHKVWLNGSLENTISQGPMSNLWKGSPTHGPFTVE